MNLILKYIIAGSTAALVDLSILNYMDSVGFHHRISVNVAFISAFMVSFLFQKYWTFSDSLSDKVHKQLRSYFIVSVVNVILNGIIVEILLNYGIFSNFPILRELVWAQILSSTIIATESFIVYRYFIFKKNTNINLPASQRGIMIITQSVDKNDAALAFFIDWIVEFSKLYKRVIVICLRSGEYNLPANVRVHSLNNNLNTNKLLKLYYLNKYSYIERGKYDNVFCHMSPLFVMSGFVTWKLLHKKISLWYVHRSVDFKLRISDLLSDYIFSSTKEGYRINSKKVKYFGQAIPLNKFSYVNHPNMDINSRMSILTIGRISKIKNLDYLINTVKLFNDFKIEISLNIIGEGVTKEDIEYKQNLINLISKLKLNNNINFIGKVLHNDLSKYYHDNDIFVNLSPSGGQDKVVLEAMSSGIPTFVANNAFKDFYGDFSNYMIFDLGIHDDLFKKIIKYINYDGKSNIIDTVYTNVVKKADLSGLINKISNEIR